MKINFNNAKFIKGVTEITHCPTPDKPEICLVGNSNVGKSSLINAITNHHSLARSSKTPGRTQEINFFLIDDAFYLVDLPGIGYSSASRNTKLTWSNLIPSYLSSRFTKTIIYLCDIRHPEKIFDVKHPGSIQHITKFGIKMIMVLTKADKLSGNTLTEHLKKFKQAIVPYYDMIIDLIVVSVQEKPGIDDLHQSILNILSNSRHSAQIAPN